jgi:hypothetical protein
VMQAVLGKLSAVPGCHGRGNHGGRIMVHHGELQLHLHHHTDACTSKAHPMVRVQLSYPQAHFRAQMTVMAGHKIMTQYQASLVSLAHLMQP